MFWMLFKVFKDMIYGWLVVVICFVVFFLFIGNVSCFGLVEVELGSLFKDFGFFLLVINVLYNGFGWGLGKIGFILIIVVLLYNVFVSNIYII